MTALKKKKKNLFNQLSKQKPKTKFVFIRQRKASYSHSQLSGIISATRRMILTKNLFRVDSVLHLSLQREATQLMCLTIYVGTTKLSTMHAKTDLTVVQKKKKNMISVVE